VLGDLVDNARVVGGVAALLAGVTTAIHKACNCDAHQAECKRLARAYHGLATRYERVAALGEEEARVQVRELDETLAQLREGAQVNVRLRGSQTGLAGR
jgi:hypothetical protein